MTIGEKLEILSVLSGETDKDILSVYLDMAGNIVCRHAFPYDKTVTEVPEEYVHNQLEIAGYLLGKRGAEGETAHSENGISRSYESGSVPDSMLKAIIQMVGVPS